VEVLVRLQAEATCNDFLLDLGGAAEDRNDFTESGWATVLPHNRLHDCCLCPWRLSARAILALVAAVITGAHGSDSRVTS
jgi:hypothetical protein